jgi:hypothetical protein
LDGPPGEMKVKFDEYHKNRKDYYIKNLQNKIRDIDNKILRLEKIKPGSLHTMTLKVKRTKLLVQLAKERMFGN